jgi:hypothetical protein
VQVTTSVTVDLPASGDVGAVGPVVIEAGRRAMAEARRRACPVDEGAAAACPGCGGAALPGEGRRRRVLLCRLGRPELHVNELRGEGGARRFRPAEASLACLGGADATATLRHACILAGASRPYATAAAVPRDRCGATISREWPRQVTKAAGATAVAAAAAAAPALASPTGAAARSQRAAAPARPAAAGAPGPPLLMVGLDGGRVASRDQAGGMDGTVGVVAGEAEAIGRGRRRLTRRRSVATVQGADQLGLLA